MALKLGPEFWGGVTVPLISQSIIYLYTFRGGPPRAYAKCKSHGPSCTSQSRCMYNRNCGK